MGKLNLEEEMMKINNLKSRMLELDITYSDVLRTFIIDNSLRSWFNARRTSLLNGSLEDEEVLFYKKNEFDFGIKLLLWVDWCNMLKEKLQELHTNYIGESIRVESRYCLGKWLKRQNKSWRELSNDRKILLLETGVKIKCLYDSYSPFQRDVIYNGIKYENAIDFFLNVGAPLEKIFEEIDKWGNTYVAVLIKEYGGTIETGTYHDFCENIDAEISLKNNNTVSRKGNTHAAIDVLMNLVDMNMEFEEQEETIKNSYKDIQKKEEEENNIVKSKLLEFCSEDEMNLFLPLISTKYKKLLLKNNSYPILSVFDLINLEKMFVNNLYVDWVEDKSPSIQEDGCLYAEYFSYAICTFEYGVKEVKKISLDIKCCNDSREISGGFYCKGEEYVHLSSLEINKLLKNALKKYSEPFKNYKKLRVYNAVFDILSEIERTGKVNGSRKVNNMIETLEKDGFIWEKDDGYDISSVLSDNTVNIKKLKNIYEFDLPQIYMISNIHTYTFEPYLSNEICIVYKGNCYIFEKTWKMYQYYKTVIM